MKGAMTLYEVSLVYHQITTNSAVNKNITNIIKTIALNVFKD